VIGRELNGDQQLIGFEQPAQLLLDAFFDLLKSFPDFLCLGCRIGRPVALPALI
jgi:hypothetical protein